MSKRYWSVVVVLWLCHATAMGWIVAGAPAKAPAADKKDKPAATDDVKKPAEAPGIGLFGLTKIHQFHLEFTAKEWQAIEPAGGGFPGFPGGPGGPGRPPEKPAEKPDEPKRETHKGGSFNIEFPWVHGEFVAEGKTYKDVGFRYKGGGSYVSSVGKLKRNFKVELDRYDVDNRFHGLKTLNLNAGVMDPTKWRESLAFEVFRAAGVPAPRTAYAEVTLTVPGKYDKEYVGLYTVIEQVDRTFLKAHFKSGKGLLLKPERVRPLEYLGEDWDKYKDRYEPKHEATKDQARRVIEFAKLVNRADDEQFRKEIASYLDVDEFLRFFAATALLSNVDSFFTIGHNVYLYLDPETNKFVFIPWDMDLSFGGFFLVGSVEQQADLSLTHPYPGENKLVERLLAMKDVNEQYQKVLKELAATAFAKEKLQKDIDAVEKATKELIAKDAKAAEARKERGGFGFGPPGGGTPDLRKFVEKRSESIAAQLAGKSKGTVPGGFGFGPPGGFGGPPQPGQILAPPVQDQLKLNADQKKKLEELQKEADAQLEKILTEDQKKQLKAMRQGPGPGGPPGGGPGRPPQPPD